MSLPYVGGCCCWRYGCKDVQNQCDYESDHYSQDQAAANPNQGQQRTLHGRNSTLTRKSCYGAPGCATGADIVEAFDERVAVIAILERRRVGQGFAVVKLRVAPAACRSVLGGVLDHELNA